MRGDIYRWLRIIVLVVLLSPAASRASHIIGGDVSMQAVGSTPGFFRLQLNQYWDETKTSTGNRDASVQLLIYRKQNPVLVESVTLKLRETLPLTFDNAACATIRQLSFTQARYYDTYQFNPQKYTDPGGYYIVWERCCRNDALTNVNTSTADGAAMTFYLEFPPMLRNGVTSKNSSPEFGLPNGSYICLNKPVTLNADATDADGDQLRYSLVTPLNGYTSRSTPNSINDAPRSSYPPIVWAAGYGLTNIIPGSPSLAINATTGQLSVRATREGLFLFTVQCEEFRNGQRIGVVRRDFQLPVVDCSKNTPPPAIVLANGTPVSQLTWCQRSQPLVLTVEKNLIWAYQWQKDGANLRGSTADTLRILESGTYTVVKSQANVCANDTTSQAIKITLVTALPVSLSVIGARPYCTGDTISIQAGGAADARYRWRRNGADMAGERQSQVRVTQSGLYTVLTQAASQVCDGQDSIRVTLGVRPTVQFQASALAFCPNASVQLTATSSQTGSHFAWRRDNTQLADTTGRVNANQVGVYQVTATAPDGCTASSGKQTLSHYAVPVVHLDSILPMCATGSPIVTLQGQPVGGRFVGNGVQGNQFNPSAAGAGRHALTYTIVSDKGCSVTDSLWAEVLAGPALTGQTTYELIKGNSVRLATQSSEPISRYRWEPPGTLSQSDVASPVATPKETTTYQLTAIGAAGCVATLTVLVEITEPLYIPSAFSPNSDGVNDAWIIPNIGSFPDCEVSVFNRWGELIFHSRGYAKPWDGTYHETAMLAGIYTYQIHTRSRSQPAIYRGQLTLVR